jgi:hypothetical protein
MNPPSRSLFETQKTLPPLHSYCSTHRRREAPLNDNAAHSLIQDLEFIQQQHPQTATMPEVRDAKKISERMHKLSSARLMLEGR